MKSSFLERISLLKVLQELLRPWYKSASSHKPNRPLKRLKKNVKTFQSYNGTLSALPYCSLLSFMLQTDKSPKLLVKQRGHFLHFIYMGCLS